MVGILVFCASLSLANQQIVAPARMIVFGGPNEPSINQMAISDSVKKEGTKIGWNETKDGKLVYSTPKQMSYVFLPSLRELVNLKTVQFFREKLEKGGPNQIFPFSDLPESMRNQLQKAFSHLDITDQSSFTFNVNLIPHINSTGRSVGVPMNFNPIGKPGGAQNLPIFTMTPISPKTGATSETGPRAVPPSYQIWPIGTNYDTNRTEMINEAMIELKNEMSRRAKIEDEKILDILKEESEVKALKGMVGQQFKLMTTRPSDLDSIWQYQLGIALRGRRNYIGLSDNQDWTNFVEHAQIDSLSTGFSLMCVQLVDGKRMPMAFDYSL